jgi:succinate dehydrogenase / fumarate reductase cytochrome b subunit
MRARPLSPHLSVYRFEYTMALSITHRIMGVALSVGLPLLAYWLWSVAAGPAAYDRAVRLFSNLFVKLLVAGWIWAFVYHFSNGIRHLVWDTGHGFEKKQARTSGLIVVVAAVAIYLTLLWFLFGSHRGAP